MPELPDVEAYRFALEKRIVGARLDDLKLGNPFILRSVIPTPEEVIGQQVTQIRRLGKRIVISLSGDQHIVIHLMIARSPAVESSCSGNAGKVARKVA